MSTGRELGAGLGLAMVAAFGLGCAEDPSYLLDWRIAEDVEEYEADSLPQSLDNPLQCTEHGFSRLELLTRRASTGGVVDRREIACFPDPFGSGDLAPGPEVDPGDYVVELRALRRSGEPWDCGFAQGLDSNGDDVECDDGYGYDEALFECVPCVGRALAEVTVPEDKNDKPRLRDLLLLAPLECDDGVDNDRDGRTDAADFACQVDETNLESFDAFATLFDLGTRFLSSDIVVCGDVSVTDLAFTLDGEFFDVRDCSPDLSLFAVPVDDGDHVLGATGLELEDCECMDGSCAAGGPCVEGICDDGAACSDASDCAEGTCISQYTPRTSEVEAGFSAPGLLGPENGGIFEFEGSDFLEPVVSRTELSLAYRVFPGDGLRVQCDAPAAPNGGTLVLDVVRLQVLDENDDPVAIDALGFDDSVDVGNGWIELPCPPATLKSEDLTWGTYRVNAEARAGDVVCFATEESQDLRPGANATGVTLQRVLEDDAAPAGCEDCETDDDCDFDAACGEDKICHEDT